LNKEFKLLAKNTSMLAGTRVFEFLTGLFRIKLSAILLGTVGVGLVDQFNFLTNKISRLSTIGTVEGFVKQIASNSQDDKIEEILNSVIKSYVLIIFGFVIISSTISIFLKDFLTNYIFGDIKYVKFFYLALLTFPLLVLGTIPFSILKAFKNIKAISRSRIYIVIVQVLIAIPMIYFFELNGAIIYIPISFVIDFLFLHYFAKKYFYTKYKISIATVVKAPLITVYVKELFLFSGFGLTVGIYAIVSETVSRSIVISTLGIEAIGVYTPVILFSSLFKGFILPALSTYLYPRFCELSKNIEIKELLNSALRLSTLMLIPFIFIGISFQKLLIPVFFSLEFIEATDYLPYHFLGIIFFVWSFVFSQWFTPSGKIKVFGLFRIIYFSINIVVTFYAVRYFGLYGWMLTFLISPFIFFFVYKAYISNKITFTIDNKNVILMIFLLSGTILLILLQSLLRMEITSMILGPILLVCTYFFLNKEEVTYLVKLGYYLKK
jgi:O-antigen/teichoic acid export membrane protein